MAVTKEIAESVVERALAQYQVSLNPLLIYKGNPRWNIFAQFVPFLAKRFWTKVLCSWASRLSKEERIQAIETLVVKNKLYGSKPLRSMGSIGIFVRSMDKVERIINMEELGLDSEDESRKDSELDLHNYAILALLLLDKKL